MNKFFLVALPFFLFISCDPNVESSNLTDRDRFVNDLLSQMTLEEKLGQLNLPVAGDIQTGLAGSSEIGSSIKNGQVGGLFNVKSVKKIRDIQKVAVEESRLGIPLLFAMDVIHGYRTTFPIPLATSCSWNMDLIENLAHTSAVEATADGINWTFSPMVDLSRDPRWGRVAEGPGEDPFLASQITKAMVKGYQGDSLGSNKTLMSCVKHFALYGAPIAGREYNTVDMSRLEMYNTYFPPYQAGVDAGAGTFMASFNDVEGVPATGNKWLLTDVLRKEWGFKGFVVSDYTAIQEMVEHGVGDFKESARLALDAGMNMDMVSEAFIKETASLLNEGSLSMSQVDQSVRLILNAKYDLGLFDDPYRYCDTTRPQKDIYTQDHRDFARELSHESMVLLKNDGHLPLDARSKIALIGPLGNNKQNMAGTWSVATDLMDCVSLYEGMKAVGGDDLQIEYAQGANFTYDEVLQANATMFGREMQRKDALKLRKEAIELAKRSDIIVAALGEPSEMSGECAARTNPTLPDAQADLLKELVKTGKPIVLVLFSGRPLVLTEQVDLPNSILQAWFQGTEAGLSIADVLFGKANPSGKLTMTWPRAVGQIPIYYNHKNTGRPLKVNDGRFEKFLTGYIDEVNDPLFPFGYGLSYTQFTYSNIQLSQSELTMNDTLWVSVDLTNTGSVDGKEVVQLYIRDIYASTTRPVKELKAFQKVFLNPGESTNVKFALTSEMLSFYNYKLEKVIEPGEFKVFIGTNSDDTLEAEFSLTK